MNDDMATISNNKWKLQNLKKAVIISRLNILKNTHSSNLQMNALGALLKVVRAKTFSCPFYFLSVS